MTFIPRVANSLMKNDAIGDDPSTTNLIASTLKSQRGKAGGGIGPEETLIAAPLTSGGHPNRNAPGRRKEDDENLVAYALRSQERNTSQGNANYVNEGASVRRLTPTECERLQGFPDGWTQLGDTADSPRYAALGDAVTVPVAEWIGRRILAPRAGS